MKCHFHKVSRLLNCLELMKVALSPTLTICPYNQGRSQKTLTEAMYPVKSRKKKIHVTAVTYTVKTRKKNMTEAMSMV